MNPLIASKKGFRMRRETIKKAIEHNRAAKGHSNDLEHKIKEHIAAQKLQSVCKGFSC